MSTIQLYDLEVVSGEDATPSLSASSVEQEDGLYLNGERIYLKGLASMRTARWGRRLDQVYNVKGPRLDEVDGRQLSAHLPLSIQ